MLHFSDRISATEYHAASATEYHAACVGRSAFTWAFTWAFTLSSLCFFFHLLLRGGASDTAKRHAGGHLYVKGLTLSSLCFSGLHGLVRLNVKRVTRHAHTCTQNSPSAPTRMLTSRTGVCRRACLGQFQQTRIQASSLLPPEHVLFGVVKWKLDVQLYWLDPLHSLQKVY